PAFAGLTSLAMEHVPLTEKTVETLARGPWRGLLRLRLGACIDAAGAAALLHPEALPQLTVLDLSMNGISNSDAEKLLDRPRPPRLAQLSLVYNSRGSPRLQRLERPAAFPQQSRFGW